MTNSESETSDQQSVLGEPLEPCSVDPVTGYLRDGYCRDVTGDRGEHCLCAELTAEFLEYSAERGNDLRTPQPALDFPGLDPGDRWCLCVDRWIEALAADCAPPVVLAATHEHALDRIERETLDDHAVEG
ncbi:DUF2237 family protein [Halococcoides cellulosivorans]|uniref:DUF2237 domain-containing protein n=1 Tax=Halococcoides cellulosivorans TaxID=1679096 RepID=A0A2R4X4D7_9EURY|nr:DUF2237 domain-containing protein [Halococcoides cellulosivorans]AWB28648.1 DUF2237 domain-containing protein [Halococcoides cellulosivorans]